MRRNVAASACRSLHAWVMTRREKRNVEAPLRCCGPVPVLRRRRVAV